MSDTISEVADALFSSGCLRFGHFKIKSGASSPYYVDLAGLLSSPSKFRCVTGAAASKIKQIQASYSIDKLASIELKGALILSSIACQLDIPCVVVRKEDKAYGVTGRIAGADVRQGENILFLDDVISEGLSKLEGIKPLQALGAKITDVLVIVDREQGGKENLEKLGYRVHALAKISELVEHLLKSNHISKEQTHAVLDYIKESKGQRT